VTPDAAPAGAAIVWRRRLQWAETDASGHQHFTAVFRWLEEAEHELWRCLGVPAGLVDRLPRVKVEMDYSARLFVGDEVVVQVQVAQVGRASCEFAVTVDTADGTRAATGRVVVVHTSGTTAGSAPWPDDVRVALTTPTTWTVTTTTSPQG
jgi:acyl-CoA thioester hydrolase